ncbi:hypothetical protein [Pseudoxanthomonas mexicana]|uniref:hypothetical protein n=1 Tax=Pseudoxanthomonas mexicana TaxID=128785 RepID=UPI0028A92529|nr:hypothetical protein [Pseudoxanthomonas mexicana]
MPNDNEADEKVKPVAWIVTNGGETCEPWLEYEQSEVDALPAACIAEPLYSAATVAELRAEVERRKDALAAMSQFAKVAEQRADAAECRVGELEKLLGDRECASCTPNGVYSTDGAGPFDCYACGRKANG